MQNFHPQFFPQSVYNDAINYAYKSTNKDIVGLILISDQVNIRDLLEVAIISGDDNMIGMIKKYDPDLRRHGIFRQFWLFIAYWILRCLFYFRAATPIISTKFISNNDEHDTLVYYACETGDLLLLNTIINNVHYDNEKAMFLASSAGYAHIVKRLLLTGAYTFNQCLEVACRCGHKNVVKMLISHGADECYHCGKNILKH